MGVFSRYYRWLHGRWPAGRVERLPVTDEAGRTNVSGLYVVGDLRGVPLLKLSADTGARAVRDIAEDPSFRPAPGPDPTDADRLHDLVIIGGGVAGMSAALEARKLGLDFVLLEATEPFSTIVNFPKGKPIFTYPRDLTPAGELTITAEVKEDLVVELRRQTIDAGIPVRSARAERVRREGGELAVELADGALVRGQRVIAALGRSGNFRKLGVPGESRDHVMNRLHDPKDFCGQRCLVVGGGDSALETAIALAMCGAEVTLSYRKPELARPKPENVEQLEALTRDPLDEDAAVAEPSSERVTTAAGPFLEKHRSAGSVRLRLDTQVKEVRDGEVEITDADGASEVVPNDVVFTMIGRKPPLDFFRRSGVSIVGERSGNFWASLIAIAGALAFLYHWKAGGKLTSVFETHRWFPFNLPLPPEPVGWLATLATSFSTPAAWYSLAYTLVIVIFGVRRIRRRRTPYVTAQTWTLMLVQAIPLFVLPIVVLPWVGSLGGFGERFTVERLEPGQAERWLEWTGNGATGEALLADARAANVLPAGIADWPELRAEVSWKHRQEGDRVILRSAPDGQPAREAILRLSDGRVHLRNDEQPASWWVDQLFPASEWDPHGREYWRAAGLILAWPLFLWNVFTHEPMTLWLIISLVQTFVLIPILVYYAGKGAYCGWICSCGGLAETLGDTHRHKMPHGPVSNRWNLAGQVILALALVLLVLRVAAWMLPWDHPVHHVFQWALYGKNLSGASLPFPFSFVNYKWVVDLLLAGIVGTGMYFHFSGRVWCRFACPLAALMHIYARFSRFRILADKKKCISCNVCTSVCHQGIDVMNFANKGLPMADPECVRCSACVQSCPTGVLAFGQVDAKTDRVIRVDRLAASPVRMREGTRHSAERP